jgi:hypothetical protein
MRPVLVAALCAAFLVLASCATLQKSADSGVVRTVTSLINKGDDTGLAAMSAVPFLVDGDIVTIPGDIAAFWAAAVKAGFKVDGAALDAGTAVTADSYKQFASTMEVKTFFTRYVPSGSRVLDLTSGAGAHLRLIVHSTLFSTRLYGMKGPF